MRILKYSSIYREKCIEIFKSNLPTFFAPDELEIFENFLDYNTKYHYFVLIPDGELICCGGIFSNDRTNEAGLSWGMVHAQKHNKGIGKFFTDYRINLLRNLYPNMTYKIETSQHTFLFYQKRGFVTVDITLDGFGEGIDKYIMELKEAAI